MNNELRPISKRTAWLIIDLLLLCQGALIMLVTIMLDTLYSKARIQASITGEMWQIVALTDPFVWTALLLVVIVSVVLGEAIVKDAIKLTNRITERKVTD